MVTPYICVVVLVSDVQYAPVILKKKSLVGWRVFALGQVECSVRALVYQYSHSIVRIIDTILQNNDLAYLHDNSKASKQRVTDWSLRDDGKDGMG